MEMLSRLARLLLTAVFALCAASTAQAFCIVTSDASIPPNDVGLMGCDTSGPGAVACDMNGTQGRWATHGVLAIENDLILSWTRNMPRLSEEYVCRINLTTGASEGAVHIFSGVGGVAKDHKTFECRILTACPTD